MTVSDGGLEVNSSLYHVIEGRLPWCLAQKLRKALADFRCRRPPGRIAAVGVTFEYRLNPEISTAEKQPALCLTQPLCRNQPRRPPAANGFLGSGSLELSSPSSEAVIRDIKAG